MDFVTFWVPSFPVSGQRRLLSEFKQAYPLFQLQGESAEPRGPVQPGPADPMGRSVSHPLELESKPAAGISDTEATERAENLENNENKKDGVCG